MVLMHSDSSPARSLDLPSISCLDRTSCSHKCLPLTQCDKLVSFVYGVPFLENSNKIKEDLAQEVFPWFKQRHVEK
jgi:hypothetical protein